MDISYNQLLYKLLKSVHKSIFMMISELQIFRDSHKSIKYIKKIKKNDTINLNLGSGTNLIDGFINFDMNKFKNTYYDSASGTGLIYYNLTSGIPFDDNSVDYIYSSHFLEHLYTSDAEKLLKECLRVLKKGGTLRFALPEPLKSLNKYLDLDDKTLPILPNRSKKKMHYIPGNDNRCDDINCIIFEGYEHKYIYTPDKFMDILEYCGFSDVENSEYDPDFQGDLESRKDKTFYISAIKK